jgi:hypothetical protein
LLSTAVVPLVSPKRQYEIRPLVPRMVLAYETAAVGVGVGDGVAGGVGAVSYTQQTQPTKAYV